MSARNNYATNIVKGAMRLGLDNGEQLIMAEWLFVETLDDVCHRSQNPSKRRRYELLGIAPLLRKLLIDGTPLLHIIRRERRETPVEFRIRPWNEGEDPFEEEGLKRHLGLGGEELRGGPDTSPIKNLDKFSKTVVGIAQGKPLTVRDVIRYYAHIEGGVHFGKPEDQGQTTLSQMAPLLLGHSTGQIEVLAYIGQIVVDALDPLRRSVLTEPTVLRPLHVKDERGLFIGHWTTEYHAAYG